jgi:hypothetical protein
MLLRRIVYYLQFPMAVVLPVWVLITRGVIDNGIGWEFIAYLIVCPILFISLLVIGGLVAARKTVRVERAVSWPDTAVLIALWVALIAGGLYALQGYAILVIVLLLGGFWLAIYELFADTRRRINEFSAALDEAARQPSQVRQPPGDAGPIYVVPPPIEDK